MDSFSARSYPRVIPAKAGTHNHRPLLLRKPLPQRQNEKPRRMGPGSRPGRRVESAASMDRDFLIDLFSDFGPVTIRPMFSGFGISADGINFAMALRAGLYFRADDQTIPQFEAEGSKPFQYQTRAKTVTVSSYWQLPARLFDDPEVPSRLRRPRRMSHAHRDTSSFEARKSSHLRMTLRRLD